MFINQLIEGCELTLTASFGSNSAVFTSKASGIYYPGDKEEISDFLKKIKSDFQSMWLQKYLLLTEGLLVLIMMRYPVMLWGFMSQSLMNG